MQDRYGRTLNATTADDGSLTYTATDPDGTDSGITLTGVPPEKSIDAVRTTFDGMAPGWWVPPEA